MEVLDFRNNFSKLNAAARTLSARRIRKLYLMSNSAYPFEWPADMTKPKISQVLEKIAANIEVAEITIFDDIGYLALLTLEKAFNGSFSASINYKENFPNFRGSPFYQAMRNDFRGTAHLSFFQYKRAEERVIEMCNTITMEMSTYENIVVLLEELGLDGEISRQGLKKKQHLHVSKSVINLSEDPTSPSGRPSKVQQFEGTNHAFLPCDHTVKAFCEYCFEAGGAEDTTVLYLCDTCQCICHRKCRDYFAILCVKTAADTESSVAEYSSEKIRLIQEKLVTIQREVDIELKMQEGLAKIGKAASSPKKAKKSALEKDIVTQLEKNSKRLDVLKHEMQKRKVQLQTMQLAAAAPSPIKKALPLPSVTDLFDGLDTGLLRVLVVDPVTKVEFKKAIYITENQSTVEVIVMVLDKSNLNGMPNDFQLSYRHPDKELLVVLKDEDRPTQIEDINYADTLFVLQVL